VKLQRRRSHDDDTGTGRNEWSTGGNASRVDPYRAARANAHSQRLKVATDIDAVLAELPTMGAPVLNEDGGKEHWGFVVRTALAAMGSDDPIETAFEADLELFCRTAGVHVAVADVTGPRPYAAVAEE
jgi:hypothetical protein